MRHPQSLVAAALVLFSCGAQPKPDPTAPTPPSSLPAVTWYDNPDARCVEWACRSSDPVIGFIVERIPPPTGAQHTGVLPETYVLDPQARCASVPKLPAAGYRVLPVKTPSPPFPLPPTP